MLAWTRANVTEVAAQERQAFHASTAIHVGDDAGDRARQIIEELRRQSSGFEAVAERKVRQAIQREGAAHTRKWTASVKAGAQIDITNLLADDDLVDLLSIKSEQFVGLIKNLSGDMASRIEREVLGSIFEGRSNADVAKALREIDGIGRNRARLIARDQATKLNSAMNEFRQQQAGVTHYRWRTIMDGRERETHGARNEKLFAWDKPPSGGHPGSEINCRCRAVPVLIESPEDVPEVIGETGDPGDPFDEQGNASLLERVAGTMSEDVLYWPRDKALIRAAEVRRAKDIVAAARAEASFLEEQAEELFETIFGFGPDRMDLTRGRGPGAVFARRRTLIFAAIKERLDAIEELLDHAAATAPLSANAD